MADKIWLLFISFLMAVSTCVALLGVMAGYFYVLKYSSEMFVFVMVATLCVPVLMCCWVSFYNMLRRV